MYKTVRKGDASLQYTILPQTDQFNASGFPITGSKARPRALKYMMVVIVMLIILSCVATPFMINQKDHNLFAGTILSMGRAERIIRKNSTKTETEGGEFLVGKEQQQQLGQKSRVDESERRGSDGDVRVEATSVQPEEQLNPVVKNPPVTLPPSTTSSIKFPSISLTASQRPTSSESSITIGSSLSSSSSSSSSLPSVIKFSTETPSKKLPRVTLKLRDNETIPQMYMKAGIASYKKGNITTSVLAHGLSLEGLIFKTPEGTVKPWPQKWPFADPSSYFQWKGITQVPRTVYFILGGLAALATVSIILMTYIQWNASRRQRGTVQVLEIEGQEEDESTLLGPESQETAEKE